MKLIKTYKYPEEQIKEINKPFDAALRLDESIDVKPEDADFIFVPTPLYEFKSREEMKQLPLFEEMEEKHVFFHCSDYEKTYDTTAILFQCNLRDWMLAKDINSISTAWPVGKEDIDECFAFDSFTHDVGFHGWLYSDWRKESYKSVEEAFGDKFDSAGYPDFAGYLDPKGKEWIRRRGLFLNSLKHSRIQLCPQSITGVWPYRAWEAMCAGRVAALICSGDVRPMAGEIDYDQFILTIPAEQASRAGEIIKQFLDENDDLALIERGKMARKAYTEKLDSRNWDKFFRITLEKHLWS